MNLKRPSTSLSLKHTHTHTHDDALAIKDQVSTAFKVPRELSRRESDFTEIAMAFALPDIIGKSPSDTNDENESFTPAAQNVFAYLPLRSYGLKFIIQADWKV